MVDGDIEDIVAAAELYGGFVDTFDVLAPRAKATRRPSKKRNP